MFRIQKMFRSVPREEVYRKLLHGLIIIFPLAIFYGPTFSNLERSLISAITFVVLLFSIFVEVLRLINFDFGKWFFFTFGSMLRVEERSRLTGATYMAGATFLCALTSTLNEKFAACSCLSLTLFILGDAVAAIIGKSMGRIRVGEKTLEGTIACFLLCLCLGYLIFPYLPGFLEKWGGAISLTQATIVGISIALLELFPIKIKQWQLNDNLYVPVLVAYIAYLI